MKKLVALLLVAVMSIAAFGALAESTQFELILSKDPSEYKILIYWPAPDEHISMQRNYEELVRWIGQQDMPVFIMPTYTAMLELRQVVIRHCGGADFWE